MNETLGAIVEDRLLDGRLLLHQPRTGHRAGTDAILLAAVLPDLGAGPLLDMGAGVGTVGLAAALTQPALAVTLVERDPELAALAQANVAANRLTGRVAVIQADIEAPARTLADSGLGAAGFACVALNPPFYTPGRTRASPVPNRRAAHVAEGGLALWLKAARRLLRPGGTVAVIHHAQALPELLAGLDTGFGGIAIRPIHGLAGKPAIRVLVTATLNSKGPAAMLPALVLNSPDGGFTQEAEAVHRGRASLRPV
jgi:tRNA1(Val) A37 N6-methylase TrmN6